MPDISVTITNATAENDTDSALFFVERENHIREQQSPPGTPLPTTPASALKDSVEEVLAAFLLGHWDRVTSDIRRKSLNSPDIQTLWRNATSTGRDAAETALENNQQ